MAVYDVIREHISVIEQLAADGIQEIEMFASICKKALQSGHTIYFCGNGGSAADSQHLAAEFVGRFQKERRGLPAVALTTDTSILTALSNDYGYQQVFARQVEALLKSGDVLVGLSTSGNSPNVVAAAEAAHQLGAFTVAMTGRDGGQLGDFCDLCVKVPSGITARIQETHILIGHIICQMLDEVFCDVQKP